jgi:hypothetical protein
MLRKSPGFTAIAVVSLALGIGVNTAAFTLAKTALLDTLSVSRPDQLHLLGWIQDDRSVVPSMWGDFYPAGKGHNVVASFSYPVYEQLRRQNHSLGDLFAFKELGSSFDRLTATIDDLGEMITGELVSGDYFQGFGVRPVLGRPLEPADDTSLHCSRDRRSSTSLFTLWGSGTVRERDLPYLPHQRWPNLKATASCHLNSHANLTRWRPSNSIVEHANLLPPSILLRCTHPR